MWGWIKPPIKGKMSRNCSHLEASAFCYLVACSSENLLPFTIAIALYFCAGSSFTVNLCCFVLSCICWIEFVCNCCIFLLSIFVFLSLSALVFVCALAFVCFSINQLLYLCGGSIFTANRSPSPSSVNNIKSILMRSWLQATCKMNNMLKRYKTCYNIKNVTFFSPVLILL